MARFTTLMYTVDDSDDEETVYLVDTCPQQAAALLHRWHATSCETLLGTEGELGRSMQEHEAGGAKLAQLLMQWIEQPDTDNYLTLMLSNARRNLLPLTKPQRGAPVAPPVLQRRWSTGSSGFAASSRRWSAWSGPTSPRGAPTIKRRRSEPAPSSPPWVPCEEARRKVRGPRAAPRAALLWLTAAPRPIWQARDLTELSVTLSPVSPTTEARRDWTRGGGAAFEAAADTTRPRRGEQASAGWRDAGWRDAARDSARDAASSPPAHIWLGLRSDPNPNLILTLTLTLTRRALPPHPRRRRATGQTG